MDGGPHALASARVPRRRGCCWVAARPVALGMSRPGGSRDRPRDRRPGAVRRAALLAAAATTYAVAAWMVAPGFYDGFGPPQPYNWTCPPPQAGANTKPSSGHQDIKVLGGVSDANSAFTDDGQVVIGFLPGAFDVTGKTSITVDIKPVSPCPKPSGLTFAVNTYLISADSPLVK